MGYMVKIKKNAEVTLMEKKKTALNLYMITLFVGLVLFSLILKKETSQSQNQDHTEIYIINGDHEDNGWFEGPSKSELLKALMEYPEHLFITPSLWKSFCGHREQQLHNLAKENISASLDNLEINEATVYNKDNKGKGFSQDNDDFFNMATLVVFNEHEWDFFDTHAGLYYLRPKHAIQDIGLKMDTFTKIEQPCKLKIEHTKTPWVDNFINLFDLDTWNNVHKSGRKKVVCVSGHGTARHPSVSRACGVPTEAFVKLMLFLNDTLKINTLGIQSCYWPCTRILELMKNNNRPHLDCQLVTPIDQERVLYFAAEMPIVWSYEPHSQKAQIHESKPGEILLAGLHEIATSFDGTMTKELTEKLNQIHVVQINHTYNMKTSLIDAGASQPIFV